jgi:hypothetical protein
MSSDVTFVIRNPDVFIDKYAKIGMRISTTKF